VGGRGKDTLLHLVKEAAVTLFCRIAVSSVVNDVNDGRALAARPSGGSDERFAAEARIYALQQLLAAVAVWTINPLRIAGAGQHQAAGLSHDLTIRLPDAALHGAVQFRDLKAIIVHKYQVAE